MVAVWSHCFANQRKLYDHSSDPEEWTNLAQNPEYQNIVKKMSGFIPDNPAPVIETSYKLMPHHIPPLKSKEEYLLKKKGTKKQGIGLAFDGS